MASPTPKYGYNPPPFGIFSPSDEELNIFFDELEESLSTDNKTFKPTETFKLVVKRLITLYRHNQAIMMNSPNHANIAEELKRLEKTIDSLIKQLDDETGINFYTRHYLSSKIVSKTPDIDPLCILAESAVISKKYLNEILTKYAETDKKKGRPKDKISQRILEEFCRIFDEELELQPVSTEGGWFEGCYVLFLEACNFDNRGYIIKYQSPESSYKRAISKALKEYPKKKPWSLTRVQKYPGL